MLSGGLCRGHWEKPESKLLACQASHFLLCSVGSVVGRWDPWRALEWDRPRFGSPAMPDKVLNLSGPHLQVKDMITTSQGVKEELLPPGNT